MSRCLSEAALQAVEEKVRNDNEEYKFEFARRLVAEGLARGHQEGLQEGLQEGEARAVLKLLAARGLQVDEEARQRIVTCKNLEQLERWLVLAVSVRSVQELFESTPSPA